ncbi:MAG: hypothetical protein FJ278_01350 [Planctomycetes bacterium]|nr:hypothetical protein [Planctomycetota bacterium]
MSPDTITLRRSAAIPPGENAMSRRYLRVLEKWIPVGLECFNVWPERPNCGHFLGGCHWYGIETIAGALAFAAAASSAEYREKVGGCSKTALRQIASKGLRYLCFTHDTGPADCLRPKQGLGRPENWGTKWGERGKGFFKESQCGTTVAGMAIVALLLGDVVDDETWAMLTAVHEDYATRFGEMPPKSGVYLDTQMEENGWTSCGLASAALLLSPHAKSATWTKTAHQWMFATATTPQDAKNRAVFEDGATVAQLTGKTFTTLPDYMAENHGMVHPSYTATAIAFLGHLGCIYGMFGGQMPRHALFNRQRIYDQLKRMTDRHGYAQPVQGMDWSYLPPDPGVVNHAAAALLLKDPDAAALERRALETLEARQKGNRGRMYGRHIAETCRDIQDPLIVRESSISGPAYAYLLHRLYGPGPQPTTEPALDVQRRGVKVYPHSGFVFHRHEKGQTSLAWRNCIMALPLNSDGLYTVAPASSSWLGAVKVKGRPDSQDLVSIRVDERHDGFAAALAMDRAQGAIRQKVLFASLPNGNALSWERFEALETVTIESVEQGFLRIVNEHFKAVRGNCRGSRTLYTPDGADVFRGFVSQDPQSDLVRTYERLPWLNVDDRLGVVFRGSGKTVYHNRHYFNPWWAVADDLTLSRMDQAREVKAGDCVAELMALLAPDQRHARTARQKFTALSCGPDIVGLIADGYLAAANFGPSASLVTLSAPCSEDGAMAIFEGSAIVSENWITYTLSLEAGAAVLREALRSVVTDDDFAVTACATGEVLARNLGSERAQLQTTRKKKTIHVRPGQTVAL